MCSWNPVVPFLPSPSEFAGLFWSYLVLIPHCMEYKGHYKLWWAWMFHQKTNCIQVIHERIPRTTTKFLGLTPVVSETEPDMLARVLFASKLGTWQKNCTPLWYEVKHATIMTQSCKICHSVLSTLCMWTGHAYLCSQLCCNVFVFVLCSICVKNIWGISCTSIEAPVTHPKANIV